MEITVGSSHRMSFKTIQEDFIRRGKKLLKCEDLLLLFYDQSSKEFVQFRSNNDMKILKPSDIFKSFEKKEFPLNLKDDLQINKQVHGDYLL